MARIDMLPGYNCRFYLFGHCTYEEFLNPGYNLDWGCPVIAELEQSYDHLLHQAEVFNLSEARAGRIWERRLSTWAPIWDCQQYVPEEENEGCLYLLHCQCVLSMPFCPGVCRHFCYKNDPAQD